MPYLIETTRPAGLPHGEHPHDYGYPTRKSVRAVATLDEARDAVQGVVREHVEYDEEDRSTDHFVSEAMTLPESGGTVGPLPDGTAIEVRPITYPELSS